MKTENVIIEKTFQFSLRIVKLFGYLRNNKVERELALQLLRSGTSVGANTEEAMGGSSRKDFIYKLEIAYKEAREAGYWIRLLKESCLLETELANSILKDCDEIIKILTSILKTTKQKSLSTPNS
jgi:four helix bundle protein